MKTLTRLMAAFCCMTGLQAAVIKVDGTLTWKVAKPNCNFKLDGAIQNLSPYTSGTLKLALWATPIQFPSKGHLIAEYNLGQLSGGYQFNSFNHKTPVEIPEIDGKYYFTVSILEYTTSGWLNRAYVTTGRKLLGKGDFMTGAKWLLPLDPVIEPPATLPIGSEFVLSVRANEDLDGIVSGTWAKARLMTRKNHRMVIEVAGEKSDWIRNYEAGKALLNNKRVPVGKLLLDPEDSSGSSTITLYFQSPNSGFYKEVRTDPEGGFTHWGTFRYSID